MTYLGFPAHRQVVKYLYDFSVDGGAVGEIILSNKAGYDPLPAGFVVMSWFLWVETALTSGGAMTLDIGNGDDPNGYAEAIAVATLALNFCGRNGLQASALLWDTTEDAEKAFRVDDATTGQVEINIVAAALTAGKMHLFFEGYQLN